MSGTKTVFVAIPVFNRLEHTKKCIQSLERSDYSQMKIVICDDGSADNTSTYLEKNHPDISVLPGDGRLWWAGGINRCIEYILENCTSSDLIITLNNDVVVGPEYVGNMVRAHETHPNALIGSLVLFMNEPDRIETAESIHNWATAKKGYANDFGEQVTSRHHGLVSVPKLCGKGVLGPARVYQDIGLYDQAAFPHYAADEDFSMRALDAGYEVLLNFDGRVYSDHMSTGLGTRQTRPLLGEFMLSLFSRRSPNNLLIRWRLTFRHCPILLIPQHIILDFFRLTGGFCRRYLAYFFEDQERLGNHP